MSRLHICNTFFEQELEGKTPRTLKNWLTSHPVVEQLQFLPLLYAESSDKILVTKLPPNPDPRLCLIDAPPLMPIEAWAPSTAIAKEHSLSYSCPAMELVQKVQSKSFSFQQSPLPGAALLHTPEEVRSWIEKTAGPKVLKKVFGFSGRGHFFVGRSSDLEGFIRREFSQNRPLLGEPWVARTLDFSSQWEVNQTIELQGVTLFETNERGMYKATLAGPLERLFPNHLWAIESHLESARKVLEKIRSLGFFGPVGIDAFVYEERKLQPIVEINVRRTMSRVALDVQKQRALGKVLRMSLEANREGGLLPGLSKLNVFISL